MKKHRDPKTLQLNLESIRVLTPTELEQAGVLGGTDTTDPSWVISQSSASTANRSTSNTVSRQPTSVVQTSNSH